MNDNDLRALAAKLLKHYVADQNPVAEALVAQIPLNRMPAKVIPLITAEQRALLDMLGGSWAGVHEGKSVALIAQGCGGCGDCGDGDDAGGGDPGMGDPGLGDPGPGDPGDPGLSNESLNSFSAQQDAISSMMDAISQSLDNQDAPNAPESPDAISIQEAKDQEALMASIMANPAPETNVTAASAPGATTGAGTDYVLTAKCFWRGVTSPIQVPRRR